MRTELTDIAKWLELYHNPKTEQQWEQAFNKLKKVHDKYGTIDLSIIKSLIN